MVASLVLGPGVRLRDCGPFSQSLILYHGLRPSVCPSVWVGRAVSDLPDSELGVILLLGIPVCKDKASCALLRTVALGTLGVEMQGLSLCSFCFPSCWRVGLELVLQSRGRWDASIFTMVW